MTETTRPDLSQTPPAEAPARGRLAYEPPRLVTFGTVQALTQSQAGPPADGNLITPNGSTP